MLISSLPFATLPDTSERLRRAKRYRFLLLHACVDPEEAFIASLSSCHMLWFLSIAAKKKFVVESYTEPVFGVMEKNEDGRLAITKIYLRPEVSFTGENLLTEQQIKAIHEEAHHSCFLASSVKTEITVEALAA